MNDALDTAEAKDNEASSLLLEQAEEGITSVCGADAPAASSCCNMKALWNEIK